MKVFILILTIFNISQIKAEEEVISQSKLKLRNIVHFSAPIYSANCNGIIIHPKIILTTAYCANNVKIGTDSKVIWPVYKSNFSKNETKKYVYNILYTSTHPAYNPKAAPESLEQSMNESVDLGYLILDKEIPIKKEDMIPFLEKEYIEDILFESFSPKVTGYFFERRLPLLFESPLVYKASSDSLNYLYFERIEKLNSFSAPIILNLSIGKRILALRSRSLIKKHMNFIIPSFGESWLEDEIGYNKDLSFNQMNINLICKYYTKEQSNIERDTKHLNVLKSLLTKYKHGAVYENLPSCLSNNIIELAKKSIFRQKIKESYEYRNARSAGLKESDLLTAGTLALNKKLDLSDYIKLRKNKLDHYLSIDISMKFTKNIIDRNRYFKAMSQLDDHLSTLSILEATESTPSTELKEKP